MEPGGRESHFYEQTPEQQREIDAYWTKDRIQNAIPVEPPTLSVEEFQRLTQREGDADTGTQVVPSGETAVSPEARLAGAAYPVNVDQRPYWNGCKLFFTNDSGQDRMGSGSFVGTNRVLMTAGHCVRNSDNGNWYRNFLFIRGGTGHWYGWTGQRVSVNRVGCYYMFVGGNYQYDYAFCAANSDSGAGWLGLTTNIPYASFTSLGYPSNYDNANSMYGADGNMTSVAGGIVRMAGNPMGPGCSGGPWVGDVSHEYNPQANIACGLNSFGYDSDPGAMYGPYFDGLTRKMWDAIRTGGPI